MKGGADPRSLAARASLVLLLAACQAPPPPRVPAPAPPERERIARLRAGEPAPAPGLGPALVGEPAEGRERAQREGVLRLEDTLLSVERHFPLLLAAFDEIEIAAARETQALGAFDTRLRARGKSYLEGFYENDRFDALLEQPTTLWGTTFLGGYRYGTGNFAVYDGEEKTNDGGELRLGVNVPLLQGRHIDPRRVALWQARLQQDRAEALLARRRLEFTRLAADAHWRWISWGRKREIARRLLGLAEGRQEQVGLAADEGLLPRIALVDNQRLIVERRSNLVRAERGLQEAGILLSLYLRDEEGRPLVPDEGRLPGDFPEPRDPREKILEDDPQLALSRRPELRALEVELRALQLERDLARNEALPALDLGLFASQDVGTAVNFPDDKSDFELEARVGLSVPLQRRTPLGRRRELDAQISRLGRETQLAKDRVLTEVADAASALERAFERVALARENVTLAERLEEAEREQLRAGESDLLRVNLREQQTALAASALVDVLLEHFGALTAYRAVLGLPYDELLGEATGAAGP